MFDAIRKEIAEEYAQPHEKPWIVGFSGGKDSTLVAHLVVEHLLSIPRSDRIRTVHIVANDTLVESLPLFSCPPIAAGTLSIHCLPRTRQRFQQSNGRRTLRGKRMPQVPVLLQTKPEIRSHAGDPLQPERRIRRHASLATDDFIEPRIRNSKPPGERRLRYPQRLQKFLQQHLARMSRWPARRKPPGGRTRWRPRPPGRLSGSR